MTEITKDTVIGDILDICPDTKTVLIWRRVSDGDSFSYVLQHYSLKPKVESFCSHNLTLYKRMKL